MDTIDLLKKQQANNRFNFAERQKQPKSSDLYRYTGFDAETGMSLATDGTNTIRAGRITNGAIKPNQPVKVVQAGSRAVIDAMPSPKTIQPATTVESGKVKILYLVEEGEGEDLKIVVYIGGWKNRKSIKLAEYPIGTEIDRPVLNNLGGDRFSASWICRKGEEVDAITVENRQVWKFSETEAGSRLKSDFVDELGRYVPGISYPQDLRPLGFGMWQCLFYDYPPQGNITGVLGYWLKDKVEFYPWSATGSASIPIYPDRFESGTVQGIPHYASITPLLTNDKLSATLADIRQNGLWLFSQEGDRQLSRDMPNNFRFRASGFLNWLGTSLYLVNTDGFFNFEADRLADRITIEKYSFDEASPYGISTEPTKSKTKVYPLTPKYKLGIWAGVNSRTFLAASYHPN